MKNKDALVHILREAFPHLAPKRQGSGHGSAWESAPNIRKHLSMMFPGTRFSIKVHSPQEMSVRVSWTHWKDSSTPEADDVERALAPFRFWSQKPIEGLPISVTHSQRRELFAEVFGGVHSIELDPKDPTPEQRARKTRAGLQKLSKGTKAASEAPNKPKM